MDHSSLFQVQFSISKFSISRVGPIFCADLERMLQVILSADLFPPGWALALIYPLPLPGTVTTPVTVPALLECCRAAPRQQWPCLSSLVEQPCPCWPLAQPFGADLLLLGHVPFPRSVCQLMSIHIPCLEYICFSSMKLKFMFACYPLLFFLSVSLVMISLRGLLKYHFWDVYCCLSLERTKF